MMKVAPGHPVGQAMRETYFVSISLLLKKLVICADDRIRVREIIQNLPNQDFGENE
jgi:hypothetical protein